MAKAGTIFTPRRAYETVNVIRVDKITFDNNLHQRKAAKKFSKLGHH